MKIFISYAYSDPNNVNKIVDQLQKAGHSICNAIRELPNVPSLSSFINQVMDEADIFLAFITDSYNNSSYTSAELDAVSLKFPGRLLAIVIGNPIIPSSMSGILYRKYDDFDSIIAENIISDLKNLDSENKIQSIASQQEIKIENKTKYINVLKTALHNNRLTLVCGAGISISAGIPSWNTLLLSMLNKCVNTQYQFNVKSAQNALPTSNIILGKYLKLMLGNSFENTLKECLYDQLGEDQTNSGKKTYVEHL